MSEKYLIAGLAREAIEIVAPQELPFFRAYSEAFFRDRSYWCKKVSAVLLVMSGVIYGAMPRWKRRHLQAERGGRATLRLSRAVDE